MNSRKILISRSYIPTQIRKYGILVGRKYFKLLKAAVGKAEEMRDGTSRVIDFEFNFNLHSSSLSSSFFIIRQLLNIIAVKSPQIGYLKN